MKDCLSIYSACVVLAAAAWMAFDGALAQEAAPQSQPIASVLREPLPPEELAVSQTDTDITIQGPTFTYTVDKASGAIKAFRVVRDGEPVIESDAPSCMALYDQPLPSEGGKTEIAAQGKDKVVLHSEGVLSDAAHQGISLRYTFQSTFFNDGVVVTEVNLLPDKDLVVPKCLRWQVPVHGRFSSCLHKRRDQEGANSAFAALPEEGAATRFATLSSCLQVSSPEAALAIFTDSGSTHVSPGADTAVVYVERKTEREASVLLSQYIVNVAEGAGPYVMKAGEGLSFRVGLSVAPNRLPHRRASDVRMFIWVGDGAHPYPTDEEITDAARLGYTLFQMHRLGVPGEPRPPAGEFDRVLKTVHDAGMLFIWTENADLQYSAAQGVVDMQAQGKWALWQGFNYGGAYKAKMDPYCDTLATCLASPNGLAEYRLACIGRMMDRYAVDGMYLDDNLPYANCTLWKEHGHPQPVYDCLIELHEMNWRRRELLRARCPHAVLISHSTTGLFLPSICDFDAHLYGEGYSFGSLEQYWEFFGMLKSLPAQGQIWPGDTETSRCAASAAYNYDLLTGGGQLEYLDWRLYPKKFPYASGVTEEEVLFVKTYNLAQYYFGMYESEPFYFADSRGIVSTSTPKTYATVYRNRVWQDCLLAVCNMAPEAQNTAVTFHAPERLGLKADSTYAVYDVHERTVTVVNGGALSDAFTQVAIPGQRLKLFYIRPAAEGVACPIWGGKRITEAWDGNVLTVELLAPAGLEDVVVLRLPAGGLNEVRVNGTPAEFFVDSAKGLAHGTVTFGTQPVKVEAVAAEDGANKLPEKTLGPDALTVKLGE